MQKLLLGKAHTVFRFSIPLFFLISFLQFSTVLNGQQIYFADPNNIFKKADLDDGLCLESLGLPNSTGYLSLDIDETNMKVYAIVNNGLTNGAKIFSTDLDGSNMQDIITSGLNSPWSITVDAAGGKMYWTERGFGGTLKRANLDGTNVETLASGSAGLLSLPARLALDVANNHIYLANTFSQRIVRYNLDGTGQAIIYQAAGQLGDVALDLTNGKMYWTEENEGKILRADLNGTNIETVVDLSGLAGSNRIRSLALDVPNGKIYWGNYDQSKISFSNLDGTNQMDLITQGISTPQELVICNSCADECQIPCSINSPTAGTSTCEGNNTTFNVTFTTTAGPGGTLEIVDQAGTIVGSGTVSPIKVTILNSTTASDGNYTIRFKDETTCSKSFKASVLKCPPCSFTSAVAATPSCDGDNVIFDLNFAATNPPNGALEVIDGAGNVRGSGTTSPIKVTIPGPTVATTNSATFTVRYVNENSCSKNFSVSLPKCPLCPDISAIPKNISCDGSNAIFDVEFTATQGFGGNIEVVEQIITFNASSATVVGSGTTSPIKVTIPGPTVSGNKTYIVRSADDPTCNTTINVTLLACRPSITFKSGNELMFGDPCSCSDLRNCDIGGVTYFHDTLTVTPTGGTTGLTITADAGATNFFTSVTCFGGGTPQVISSGTPIPETPAGSGIYKIEFWRPSGIVPTLSVTESGTKSTLPASTFQPVCTTQACLPPEPIPTMSQWGLIIFGLLLLNLGVVFVQRRELI